MQKEKINHFEVEARGELAGRGPGTAGQCRRGGFVPWPRGAPAGWEATAPALPSHWCVWASVGLGSAGSWEERWVGSRGAAAACNGMGKEESSAWESEQAYFLGARATLGLQQREYIDGTHEELTALNPVSVLTHSVLATNLEHGYHFCLYITDEKTKA